MKDNDYLTTRDTANRLDVSIVTVRQWIKKGWLSAESTVPQTNTGPAKRKVGRYHVDTQSVATIEQEALSMQTALLKYVPREKARMKRHTTIRNGQQPMLPGMDKEEEG